MRAVAVACETVCVKDGCLTLPPQQSCTCNGVLIDIERLHTNGVCFADIQSSSITFLARARESKPLSVFLQPSEAIKFLVDVATWTASTPEFMSNCTPAAKN